MKKKNYKNLIQSIKSKIDKVNYKYYENLRDYKSKNKFYSDPVTILDKKIEKIIKKIIQKNYPNHSIIGEESRAKITNSKFTWVIDPVDGTKNLIMGLPTWSNLLGLIKNGDPKLSFANFPILKKYYMSYDNQSFVFQENKKAKKIFSNKKITNLKKAKIAINTFNTVKNKKIFKFMKKFKGLLKITNIDAYNFCLLSEGKIDILIETGLKKVDFVPLLNLIKNSGAVITDWEGKNNFNKGSILVSANQILHKKILQEINK